MYYSFSCLKITKEPNNLESVGKEKEDEINNRKYV